jgi:DNA repair protein RadA/Sms
LSRKDNAYFCNECGHESPTWAGQCQACKAWNTMTEQPKALAASKGSGGRAARARNWAGDQQKAQDLGLIEGCTGPNRLSTEIGEFDRALGGGIVPGSVVLMAGDPGIGKSTLLIQMIAKMAAAGHKTMYATGEESLGQVKGRAERLGLPTRGIIAMAETDVERIIEQVLAEKPAVLVIDSIQTMHCSRVEAAPGTVSQVRESAAQLTGIAKTTGTSVFFVGHVTKDGNIAGPRVLEHIVDAVLYFEGDPQSPFRLVRAMKNRFGSVHDIGAFAMTEKGLESVDNPSAMFLSADRQPQPGACVFIMQDGPRPILLELQALSDECAGNNPRRVAVGLDSTRLAMLLAVLHKHGGAQLGDQDVFVNAVGGLRVTDPAADLPLALALVGSLTEAGVPTDLACFGEVGLTGEVRPVQFAESRLREARNQGFTSVLVPARNVPSQPIPGLEVFGVRNLAEALVFFQECKVRAPGATALKGRAKAKPRRGGEEDPAAES